MTTWFDPSHLPGAPKALLGILELRAQPGLPALEMQLWRSSGRTIVLWYEENGRLLAAERLSAQ